MRLIGRQFKSYRLRKEIKEQTEDSFQVLGVVVNLHLFGIQFLLDRENSVGLDNIDLDAAASKNIPVVTSAGASTRAVSELCMAHLLQCARGLIQGDRATQSGAFKAFKGQAASSAHELGGKKLGLLGFGRIARVLTQREESAST